jgi:hypothetical protein
MPQKDTLENVRTVHLYAFVFYRRLSPQFQFSLSGVTPVYLSQWSQLSEKNERTLPKAAPEPPGWAGEDCACAGLAAGLLGWDPLTLQPKTITFINM